MMKTFRTATGERVAARITAEDIRQQRLFWAGVPLVGIGFFLACVIAGGFI